MWPVTVRGGRVSVMNSIFEGPFSGIAINEQVTNPNIVVGKHSYYAGYYHDHGFERCVRYLDPDRGDVDRLVIGKYCVIGSGASFIMASNQGHRADWISTFPFFYRHHSWEGCGRDGFRPVGDTVVGNDVWIGTEAMIMPSVTLGSGALIASRSVVTRDVAPYQLAAGNPARVVRSRFSQPDIERLLEIAWWDWEEEDIRTAMPILCSGDVGGLYRFWRDHVADAGAAAH